MSKIRFQVEDNDPNIAMSTYHELISVLSSLDIKLRKAVDQLVIQVRDVTKLYLQLNISYHLINGNLLRNILTPLNNSLTISGNASYILRVTLKLVDISIIPSSHELWIISLRCNITFTTHRSLLVNQSFHLSNYAYTKIVTQSPHGRTTQVWIYFKMANMLQNPTHHTSKTL